MIQGKVSELSCIFVYRMSIFIFASQHISFQLSFIVRAYPISCFFQGLSLSSKRRINFSHSFVKYQSKYATTSHHIGELFIIFLALQCRYIAWYNSCIKVQISAHSSIRIIVSQSFLLMLTYHLLIDMFWNQNIFSKFHHI